MRASGGAAISKGLVLSYVFDWLVIILIAVVGALFTIIKPNHRPFSLTDPSISFPYVANEKVTTTTLVLVALVAPAIITALISLIFIPGPTIPAGTDKRLIWRRKLWEWNTAWMGLALACATAFLLTDGMKNLFGKPRPHLLAVCQPNYTNANNYLLGGYDNGINDGRLYSWTICTQTDSSLLNDAFVSFPSGHSSFSFAGLTYLTLFFCAKFAIAIPYLLPRAYTSSFSSSNASALLPNVNSSAVESHSLSEGRILRSQAAAPPTYLLVIAIFPMGVATYISSTRYSDFMHHGFDILFGALMGFLLAWGSFRWYHAPIRRGAGWSWGPRSIERAWGVGVGVQGYAGNNGWNKEDEDLESGRENRLNGDMEQSTNVRTARPTAI